jgi:serine/threonine protein kinase
MFRRLSPRPLSTRPSAATIAECHIDQIRQTLSQHNLELGEIVGSGSFAAVYTARRESYREPLCVKICSLEDKSWKRERDSLTKIYHPNIIKLYEAFEDASFFYLVLEYCPRGTLAQQVEQSGRLGPRSFQDIAKQLLEAVNSCHSAGIAHLDIKPSNIFFAADGRIRLGDFGCSLSEEAENYFPGSHAYMPPEIVAMHEPFDRVGADMWSLGITFYFMAAGKCPWTSRDTVSLRNEIESGFVPRLTDVHPMISQLVERILKMEPKFRPTCPELIEIVDSWADFPQSGFARRMSDVPRPFVVISPSRPMKQPSFGELSYPGTSPDP